MFFFACNLSSHAQPHKRNFPKGKVEVGITIDCPIPSIPPNKSLRRLVKNKIRRIPMPGILWGNHAFPYDLNKDEIPEYLIPFHCSAVGNCEWGVFAIKPVRFLGWFWAQTAFIERRREEWSRIITYGHISASDGEFAQVCFRQGKYRDCGRPYEASAYRNDYPKFYTKAPWINCPKQK